MPTPKGMPLFLIFLGATLLASCSGSGSNFTSSAKQDHAKNSQDGAAKTQDDLDQDPETSSASESSEGESVKPPKEVANPEQITEHGDIIQVGSGDHAVQIPKTAIEGDSIFAAVDSLCDESKDPPAEANMPVAPASPDYPKTAPATCQTALEMNNLKSLQFSIASSVASGSREVILEIDAATYSAPDSIVISGSGDFGEKKIFNTCRLRTWDKADPTNGRERPPEATIRSYRARLPKGTKSLKFGFLKATTPTYLKVVGLCDFEVTKATGVDAKLLRISNP